MLFQASPWGLNYAQTVHFAGFSSILYVFQKRGKSHMASYLVTIATDFRQKGTCEKRYKQTKKKRNQNRPSFTGRSPLPTFEWEFSLLLIIYRLWSFRERGATPHVHALLKNPNGQTSSLPAWFIHSFIHTAQRILPNICCKQKAISCKVCHFQVRLFPNIILG